MHVPLPLFNSSITLLTVVFDFPMAAIVPSFPLVTKNCRDRAEGGAGGALAPPLFCKNKNKVNKK